ncbi:MAG: 2-oxo acid dehydrogenase subunit E2 [Promethearchaeota archaeon]
MKKKDKVKYEIKAFSRNRQIIVDFLSIGKKKHTVWGLFEADVTDAKKILAEYKKKKGFSLSFTAWITYCIAHAIDKYKIMHAYRKGKNKLIIFDDVDIALVVEKIINEKFIPTIYTLRAANKKSFLEIHNEIREAQSVKNGKMSVETKKRQTSIANLLTKFPGFIRRIIFKKILKDPFLKKKFNGTVGVTSVGMFGQGTQGGWGIPITPHNISFALGAIGKRPGVVGNEIKIREYLCITVAIDHDIIDGGPGTRFLKYLYDLIQNSAGLEEIKKELQET